MNIGLQYWAEGASAPGSFTTWEVMKCYPRPVYKPYDYGESELTGAGWGYERKYIAVTIVFSPKTLSNTTSRAALETLLAGVYFRVSDTRHASLGATNTINFRKAEVPQFQRDRESLATETATLELITVEPV